MDRNAYIWLLLVIYRRHDKRDKRYPAIDTDESAGVCFATLCRVAYACTAARKFDDRRQL